jgi:hypothetical protein
MHRRHALKRLVGGLAAGGFLFPAGLLGQQAGTEGRATIAGANQNQAPLPRPAAQFQMSPDVLQLLKEWEFYTRGIERIRGPFVRYVYDSTFAQEKRAEGEFWFEAPDKARIDLRPMGEADLGPKNEQGQHYNPGKVSSATGHPFVVLPDAAQRWICRGDAILIIDDDQGQYRQIDIPASMQGANITNSPLPFLFGMTAQQMQERYFMALGSMHDPKGEKIGQPGHARRPTIHVVATPRLQEIAREYSRAEVLLDPVTFRDSNNRPVYVPYAIKTLDPTGQSETVYFFHTNQAQLNGKIWFPDPFRTPGILSGLRLVEHTRAPAEEAEKYVEKPQGQSGAAAPFPSSTPAASDAGRSVIR